MEITPNLSQSEIQKAFRSAIGQGLVRKEDTALLFHDLGFLEQRIQHLLALFPPTALHALAVKANPLMKVMEFTRDISPRTGVEAASIGEVQLALRAGYEPHRIVYDSPVKTTEELEFALVSGVHLNADNFAELARIAKLLERITTRSTIGIRINPQVGTGTIAESSVAGEYSKFGVPIGSHRNALIDAFRKYPWLTGVHLHVGSQGCSLEMLVEGVGVLYDLIQDAGYRIPDAGCRIKQFDIGGGFPISYSSIVNPPSIEDYVSAIRSRCPLLFTAHCSLLTEFGRWVFTNAGWTASRVEYVKHDPGISTAMIHTGADLFLRECLNPKDWRHEYSVTDSRGNLKSGRSANPWNLAGPLCFSGDILAREVVLPEIEEGDYIIIHDTGGYTFSMWSRYNSRFAPRIVGYNGSEFQILKERETIDDLSRFWGP